MLQKISVALNHDFFKEYSQWFESPQSVNLNSNSSVGLVHKNMDT